MSHCQYCHVGHPFQPGSSTNHILRVGGKTFIRPCRRVQVEPDGARVTLEDNSNLVVPAPVVVPELPVVKRSHHNKAHEAEARKKARKPLPVKRAKAKAKAVRAKK